MNANIKSHALIIQIIIHADYLRLHRNLFTGNVPPTICNKLNLEEFYTDCANEFGGESEVNCDCCTNCCNPGPLGTCIKQ